MSDAEILALAARAETLTPAAQQAASAEISRRNLESGLAAAREQARAEDDPDASGPPEQPPATEGQVQLAVLTDAFAARAAVHLLEEAGIETRLDPFFRPSADPLAPPIAWYQVWVAAENEQAGIDLLRDRMGLFPQTDADPRYTTPDAGDEAWLPVLTLESHAEADRIRQALAAAGCPARLTREALEEDEDTSAPRTPAAGQNWQIEVPFDHLDHANDLLAELEPAEDPTSPA